MTFDLETLVRLWDQFSPALAVLAVLIVVSLVTDREIMKGVNKAYDHRFRYQAKAELREILRRREERLRGKPPCSIQRWGNR